MCLAIIQVKLNLYSVIFIKGCNFCNFLFTSLEGKSLPIFLYYENNYNEKKNQLLGDIFPCKNWPRGYKTFFMLNSIEHDDTILGLIESNKKPNFLILYTYEHLKFHAQLS